MNKQPFTKFEERLSPLRERIDKLERHHSVKGVDDIACYSAEEDDILRQLHALATLAMQAGSAFFRKFQKKLDNLVVRLESLPSVPRIEVVRLAQNILAQKPVLLVTDNTINEERQRPELTRICVMEPTETSCFDYQFPRFAQENEGPQARGERAGGDETNPLPASLEKAWAEFQEVLHGRYVVAFDFPLVQIQLAVTAQRYRLPVPMLIGHSLLDLILKYGRVKEPIGEGLDGDAPSFSDRQLCGVLAQEDVAPFDDSSLMPADQRACYLLHTLQAIANGTFSLQEPLPVSSMKQLAAPF